MVYIRRMIRALPFNDLPIELYDINKRKDNSYLTFLDTLSVEERKLFQACDEKSKEEYISSSAKIYIPDVSSDIFIEIYQQSDKSGYNSTAAKVRSIMDIKSESEEKLAVYAYIILHEVGHWFHFIELGLKPYAYSKIDENIRIALYEKQSALKKAITKTGTPSEKQEKEIQRLAQEYRSVPMENRADEFAESHLKDYMELLLQS